jgi:hypothetical protein
MSTLIYCTYLTIYSGNKLPPFYIGSSSVDRVNSGYHGTVTSKKYKSIWLEEQRLNPTAFKTIVLTKHNTRKEAIEKELFFQKSLNVVKSTMYINQSYAAKNGYFGMSTAGVLNPMKNPVIKEKHNLIIRSQEYRDNMRKIVTGRKMSEEVKLKQSITAKRIGTGKWNKGIHKSESAKHNMSEAAYNRPRIECPICKDSYTSANYNKHFKSCNGKKKSVITRSNLHK